MEQDRIIMECVQKVLASKSGSPSMLAIEDATSALVPYVAPPSNSPFTEVTRPAVVGDIHKRSGCADAPSPACRLQQPKVA